MQLPDPNDYDDWKEYMRVFRRAIEEGAIEESQRNTTQNTGA